MYMMRSAIVSFVLFVGLFTGIVNFPLNTEADIQGDWIEEIIRDIPSSVGGIDIGDVDLDGKNEVVVGLYDTLFELRMYKKEGGSWNEYFIADTPTAVTNLVVGDADNDGISEIVCTITSPANQVRMYEYVNGGWIEENITTAPVQILSLALGDADNDWGNEVVIGLEDTTYDVRAYQKSGSLWIEQNITNVLHDVAKVAIGDADNDGSNEVVIGMRGNYPIFPFPVYISNELRAYEWNGTAWPEENITDTGNRDVNSIVISDYDEDGQNEVCIGKSSIWTSGSYVDTYEKKGGSWVLELPIYAPTTYSWVGGVGDTDNDGINELLVCEAEVLIMTQGEMTVWENISGIFYGDLIVSNLPTAPQPTIGDADGDGVNEVVVGLGQTSYEVRLYANDRGTIRFTSHYDGEYIASTEQIEVAVTSNYVDAVRFYIDDALSFTDTVYPYQFILDTTALVEDATYTIKAEGVRGSNSPLVTSIDLIVNNAVPVGDYISVSTLKSTYAPDQDVSVLIGLKSPPSFSWLNLEVSYSDPSGNTLYSIEELLPYSNQYMIVLPLGSDAEQGPYTVSVDAIGISKDMMVWSDTNTTTFDVVGKSIQEQLEGINATLGLMNATINDIQTIVTDIQSNITGMNLSSLQEAIEYLNQTLNPKLDSLAYQLLGVNDSLRSRISNAETNILSDLQGVNVSLSNEIQLSLLDITDNVSKMNISLSGQLTYLLNQTTTNISVLRTWLDLVLGALDANLTATNDTLQIQLNELDAYIEGFNDTIESDIGGILIELQLHDDISGQNHSDIKEKLNQLLSGGIGAVGIGELKTMLTNLAGNLSEHNQSIADDIIGVVDSISVFETQISQKLDGINKTLDQLTKLDNILTELNDLDQDLETAQAAIDDIPMEKEEEEEQFGTSEGLLIIIIILLVIILLLMITGRVKPKADGPDALPYEEEAPEDLKAEDEDDVKGQDEESKDKMDAEEKEPGD